MQGLEKVDPLSISSFMVISVHSSWLYETLFSYLYPWAQYHLLLVNFVIHVLSKQMFFIHGQR